MATSMTVTAVDQTGKSYTRSITNVNPEAQDAQLKDFAAGIIGLTTSTLAKTDRVDRTDITNAEAKPTLTLTVLAENLATLSISTSNSQALIATIGTTRPTLTIAALFYYPDNDGDPESDWIETPYPNTNPVGDNEYSYFTGGYDLVGNLDSIGASCIATDTTISKIVADYKFAETDTTAATTYRLTIRKTAGAATFIKL